MRHGGGEVVEVDKRSVHSSGEYMIQVTEEVSLGIIKWPRASMLRARVADLHHEAAATPIYLLMKRR